MNDINNEEENINSQIKDENSIIYKVIKSICKISYSNKYTFVFLIKLNIEGKEIYCLITNGHIITNEIIESNEIISLYYDINNKSIKIKLDKNERFIKIDIDMHIMLIEIIMKDNIEEEFFLLPNMNKINYINEDIYIPQYPNGKNIKYSKGKIKNINNHELIYDLNSKLNSSSFPILLTNTTTVIGIHNQENIYNIELQGISIKSFIQSLSLNKDINKDKLINNQKLIYENKN